MRTFGLLIGDQSQKREAGGLSRPMLCILLAVAVAVVVSRRPDLLSHAHFYAEDGAIWYADAYNVGWFRALTIPSGGYLNTLQRLGAALSLLVPLRYAPLLMNVCGLIIQVLPVFFLLSERCVRWGTLGMRLMQAASYILIPNTREIHMVLTNAPFHLALLAFLVATAVPPKTLRWKFFDITVLSISALSGPFCIILLPLGLAFWWIRREQWSLTVAAILGPLAAAQVVELFWLGGYADRAPAQLGATPMLFLRILTGQIYVGSVWGENGFATNAHFAALAIIAVLGTSVLLYALCRDGLELQLFVIFAMLLLAASLNKPLIDGAQPQWQLLASDRSSRYWFFPMLALLWSMLFCATQRQNRFFHVTGCLAFLGLLHGVIHDRHYPPTSDKEFQCFVKTFEAAPAGTRVLLPSFPLHMTYLTKK